MQRLDGACVFFDEATLASMLTEEEQAAMRLGFELGVGLIWDQGKPAPRAYLIKCVARWPGARDADKGTWNVLRRINVRELYEKYGSLADDMIKQSLPTFNILDNFPEFEPGTTVAVRKISFSKI